MYVGSSHVLIMIVANLSILNYSNIEIIFETCSESARSQKNDQSEHYRHESNLFDVLIFVSPQHKT